MASCPFIVFNANLICILNEMIRSGSINQRRTGVWTEQASEIIYVYSQFGFIFSPVFDDGKLLSPHIHWVINDRSVPKCIRKRFGIRIVCSTTTQSFVYFAYKHIRLVWCWQPYTGWWECAFRYTRKNTYGAWRKVIKVTSRPTSDRSELRPQFRWWFMKMTTHATMSTKSAIAMIIKYWYTENVSKTANPLAWFRKKKQNTLLGDSIFCRLTAKCESGLIDVHSERNQSDIVCVIAVRLSKLIIYYEDLQTLNDIPTCWHAYMLSEKDRWLIHEKS